MKYRGAFFLDRDGTLIREVEYLTRIEEIEVLPGAIRAIREVNSAGFAAAVITNQSVVARGALSEKDLATIHQWISDLFRAEGAELSGFYYCPHHPTEGKTPYRKQCHCRKPEPGLLETAARELEVRLEDSFMIGDSLRDIEAGKRAGCGTILVRTGYGQQEENLLGDSVTPGIQPDYIASDILQGILWALSKVRSRADD